MKIRCRHDGNERERLWEIQDHQAKKTVLGTASNAMRIIALSVPDSWLHSSIFELTHSVITARKQVFPFSIPVWNCTTRKVTSSCQLKIVSDTGISQTVILHHHDWGYKMLVRCPFSSLF